MKTTALVLFILTYVGLLAFPKYRAMIAGFVAAFYVLLGILPLGHLPAAIDWNVLFMIFGTMGIVTLFIESKMPSLLADVIIEKSPNVKWAVVFLALFAGIISAFVDNVATVLMVAPVAITMAKKLDISPVPVIIAIAISSNLQGAATLVGDTTSILLGGYAGMDFFDFFFFHGKIGIFWAVELGAVMSTLFLFFYFRSQTRTLQVRGRTKVNDYFPTVLLVGMVVLLICASFFPDKPAITNGVICVALMAAGVIRKYFWKKDRDAFSRVFGEIDYITLLLLAGLFVIIAGLTRIGVVEDISRLFVKISGSNVFFVYTLLVWGSVLCSAFIDNIPYVAAMLPVASGIAAQLGIDQNLLYFGLLCGATLGGNLTPIGASANIAANGILQKNGYKVKAAEFMRMSVPFTLAAVTTGYLVIWFIWK